MDSTGFVAWIDGYEHAWRSPGTDGLRGLFHPDAVYLASPYAEPIVGLDAIAVMWDEERDGPDEAFAMSVDGWRVSRVRPSWPSPSGVWWWSSARVRCSLLGRPPSAS
jgi:hypothetical protein